MGDFSFFPDSIPGSNPSPLVAIAAAGDELLGTGGCTSFSSKVQCSGFKIQGLRLKTGSDGRNRLTVLVPD